MGLKANLAQIVLGVMISRNRTTVGLKVIQRSHLAQIYPRRNRTTVGLKVIYLVFFVIVQNTVAIAPQWD